MKELIEFRIYHYTRPIRREYFVEIVLDGPFLEYFVLKKQTMWTFIHHLMNLRILRTCEHNKSGEISIQIEDLASLTVHIL